eukprot:s99_g14.t1
MDHGDLEGEEKTLPNGKVVCGKIHEMKKGEPVMFPRELGMKFNLGKEKGWLCFFTLQGLRSCPQKAWSAWRTPVSTLTTVLFYQRKMMQMKNKVLMDFLHFQWLE